MVKINICCDILKNEWETYKNKINIRYYILKFVNIEQLSKKDHIELKCHMICTWVE